MREALQSSLPCDDLHHHCSVSCFPDQEDGQRFRQENYPGSVIPIWVAFRTAVGDIENIVFSVIGFRFTPIVAVITRVIGGVIVVAARADTIGAFMVHREAVPVDMYAAPAVGVMAL